MNREDLLALAVASTAEWMAPLSRGSGAAQLHAKLLDQVRRAGSSKRQTAALRAELIRSVNAASLELLAVSASAVGGLHDAQFGFEVEHSKGCFSPSHVAACLVPPFKHARSVLGLASRLQELPPYSQMWVARAMELKAGGLMPQIDRLNAESTDDEVLITRARQDEAAHRQSVKQNMNIAPVSASKFLDDFGGIVNPIAWGTWALPVQIPSSVTDEVLRAVAVRFERLRTAMYRPLPLDTGASVSALRRWRRNWRIYEDCGDTYGLIGAWLRAIATTGGARRCQICYRHLGAGMKSFCAQHIRTSKARQDSRDLQISRIYQPVLRDRLSSRVGRSAQPAVDQATDSAVREMIDQASNAGICNELARPVGTLAASLRAWYPLMSPPARNQVQQVFVRLFSIAQEPFEQQEIRTYEERHRVTWQRRQAPLLLRQESFFRALYGSSSQVDWASHRTLGEGLDVDHPAVHGSPVPPARVALDLVHLSAWLEVDEMFDRFAYLNPLQLSRLRDGDPRMGKPPMSLAQIARSVGASPEAVRQTLRHSDGLESPGERRQRIIPTGLRALKKVLLPR